MLLLRGGRAPARVAAASALQPQGSPARAGGSYGRDAAASGGDERLDPGRGGAGGPASPAAERLRGAGTAGGREPPPPAGRGSGAAFPRQGRAGGELHPARRGDGDPRGSAGGAAARPLRPAGTGEPYGGGQCGSGNPAHPAQRGRQDSHPSVCVFVSGAGDHGGGLLFGVPLYPADRAGGPVLRGVAVFLLPLQQYAAETRDITGAKETNTGKIPRPFRRRNQRGPGGALRPVGTDGTGRGGGARLPRQL